MITVRQVQPEDIPMIQEWAERRGCILEPKLVSPHGFIAINDEGKPIMTAWAALMMDVPIVNVDHVYVPRRFKKAEACQAWEDLISAIRLWVKYINDRHGYGYSLIEIVMNPVMESEAIRHGGQVSQSSYKKCHYLV